MVVYLALKYLNYSYINCQGGLRLQVLLWAQNNFVALRGIYIAGYLNVGEDLLSRQTVANGEWKPHPKIVKQICQRIY